MLLRLCETCGTEFRAQEGHRFCRKECRLIWDNKRLNDKWLDKVEKKTRPKPKTWYTNCRMWD